MEAAGLAACEAGELMLDVGDRVGDRDGLQGGLVGGELGFLGGVEDPGSQQQRTWGASECRRSRRNTPTGDLNCINNRRII